MSHRNLLIQLFLTTTIAITIHKTTALVICKERNTIYFHAPKCSGTSVSLLLKTLAPDDCTKPGWGISAAYYKDNDRKHNNNNNNDNSQVKFDAAHVTPMELEHYLHWNVAPIPQLGVANVLSRGLQNWHKFASVRNPYLRVLSSFEQRRRPLYEEVWGTDHPPMNDTSLDFEPFMKWLERGLVVEHNRERPMLAWCCSPTITHFRPATMYTHWPDGTPVSNMTIIKMEEMRTELPTYLESMGFDDFSSTDFPWENQNELGKDERGRGRDNSMCAGPTGCSDPNDIDLLLSMTPHTNETIMAVNNIYARDFELLGYCKIIIEGNERRTICPSKSSSTISNLIPSRLTAMLLVELVLVLVFVSRFFSRNRCFSRRSKMQNLSLRMHRGKE